MEILKSALCCKCDFELSGTGCAHKNCLEQQSRVLSLEIKLGPFVSVQHLGRWKGLCERFWTGVKERSMLNWRAHHVAGTDECPFGGVLGTRFEI